MFNRMVFAREPLSIRTDNTFTLCNTNNRATDIRHHLKDCSGLT